MNIHLIINNHIEEDTSIWKVSACCLYQYFPKSTIKFAIPSEYYSKRL